MDRSRRLFVIGNGQSRRDLDIDELKQHGMVYGCNGLYRDFTPDVLCVLDAGLCLEVVESGYPAKGHKCLFTHGSWEPLPKDLREHIDIDSDEIFESPVQREQFTMLGFTRKRIYEDTHIPMIKSSSSYLIWTDKNWDIGSMEAEAIDDWDCGTSASFMACKNHRPEELYWIGFDLHGVDKNDNLAANGFVEGLTYNNMYKGTNNYYKSTSKPVWYPKWLSEHEKLVQWFSDIQFYWINPHSPLGNGDYPNVHYLTYEEMYNRIGYVST